MKILLWIVIAWNSVDLVGKLILSFAERETIATALGSFLDASIYSVSLIILAVVAFKLLNHKKV